MVNFEKTKITHVFVVTTYGEKHQDVWCYQHFSKDDVIFKDHDGFTREYRFLRETDRDTFVEHLRTANPEDYY